LDVASLLFDLDDHRHAANDVNDREQDHKA
jgi:hypothetical protein